MIKGCKVPKCALLEEQYQTTEYGFRANIDANKIQDLIRDFVLLQKSPVFFILELPSNAYDEQRLRKNDTDPFYTCVYYLDGLNAEEAISLLDQYGELLVHDGLSSFGFGAHDSSGEIMASAYNIVTLLTKMPELYQDFFDRHGIPRVEQCTTAWDTFTKTTPGECARIKINGKDVFSLPEELKARGLYFAERR